MDKVSHDKLQFDAKTIIEDCIESLMMIGIDKQMIGMNRQSACSLLMLQAALRMDEVDVRKMIKTIEEGL